MTKQLVFSRGNYAFLRRLCYIRISAVSAGNPGEVLDYPSGIQGARKGSTMIRYNGINHLAMATGDMDKTIRFWRDLLGFRLVAGIGSPGYRHYFFEISPTDLLAFFEWSGVEPVEEKDHGAPVRGPFAFDHVSFGLESRDMLWELKDKLEAADVWVSEVVDHGFIHSIYSFDPNGIPIEFSAQIPGRDVRKNPVMADTNPSAVTREGSEPQSDRWPGVETPTPPEEKRVYPGAGSELFHGIKER